MERIVSIFDNKVVTTSKLIAESFGKRHDNVLRDIKLLDCSPQFFLDNFDRVKIETKVGFGVRFDSYYNITRDGFSFLVMGYTGKRASEFKEAFIKAFNHMEAMLNKRLLIANDEPLKSATLLLTQAHNCISAYIREIHTIAGIEPKAQPKVSINEPLQATSIQLNTNARMELTIENNIPAPDKSMTWKGLLDKLKVGESFPIDASKRNSVHQNISSYFHTETNKRFTISSKGQPKGKARVWRIDDVDA